MSAVTDHYAQLLAPIYLWMAGGPEAALSHGSAELSALRIPSTKRSKAIDLGAGFGMHAIPLARLGYDMTAIDSSTVLLAQLRQLSEGTGPRCGRGQSRSARLERRTRARSARDGPDCRDTLVLETAPER
jgi:SAM-dependent methyltransferase